MGRYEKSHGEARDDDKTVLQIHSKSLSWSVEMGAALNFKYQSKIRTSDIPQTHKDDGDMELCGHKTTQVLVGNSKDAAKIVRRRSKHVIEEDGVGQCNLMEGVVDQACSHDLDKMQEHHRVVVVVVCGSVSFSSSAELALGSYICALEKNLVTLP
ncbi:hypothetical protein Tco_0255559 [Tanacetum coccineum]